jgi:hypothetical protein
MESVNHLQVWMGVSNEMSEEDLRIQKEGKKRGKWISILRWQGLGTVYMNEPFVVGNHKLPLFHKIMMFFCIFQKYEITSDKHHQSYVDVK